MAALIESDFSDRSSERIPKLLNRLLVAFSGHITVFVSNAAIVMKFLFWLKSPRLHRKRIRDKYDNQSEHRIEKKTSKIILKNKNIFPQSELASVGVLEELVRG